LACPHLSLSRSFYSAAPTPALPFSPTRRSSDLLRRRRGRAAARDADARDAVVVVVPSRRDLGVEDPVQLSPLELYRIFDPEVTRSEEHTSELQSLTNLVCRLLLEKKNK